jgi:3',5'-cyclic AMP phosphodiesterase CpdA
MTYILHLSDLHFGTDEDARNWYHQLAEDLHSQLNGNSLDILILSGNIAHQSTPEEYKAAQLFLDKLCSEFQLERSQLVIVPGNHDLNWSLSEAAYQVYRRKDYQGKLTEGRFIDNGNYIEVRDEVKYQLRFQYFRDFYQNVTGKSYPLEYGQQATLHPWKNLLFVGFNSAWQIDHYYKNRASIDTNALTNAFIEIGKNSVYKNLLKIAVLHHPLSSTFEDAIPDHNFVEQLAKAGFRFVLHGHLHKAENNLFNYILNAGGRRLNIICAGTFSIPVGKWFPGYPLQYNLLKLENHKLTVYTRHREAINGT